MTLVEIFGVLNRGQGRGAQLAGVSTPSGYLAEVFQAEGPARAQPGEAEMTPGAPTQPSE